ncbi:MAG: TRZ/ATZ family hydrolase [Gammaproteobacteria bacterium]|nr:TRZ/ATZ family hydrolase [Gammaproteobacteria bacterium]
MEPVDTLIEARWVVPVEPDGAVREDHAVAVRNGRIAAVLPRDEARSRYDPAAIVQLQAHALIPGLVNAHTHAPMTLLRGLADDLPLMEWLKDHIWPAELRFVSEEFVADGTRLAAAEMLRGGTTCFSDMYFFPDVVAHAASAAGMRACVGLIVIDFPSPWAGSVEEYLDKGLAVHDAYRNDPLIHTAFAPHSPYAVAPSALERLRVYSDELDLPVHIHLHETADEIHQGLEAQGLRPLAHLARLGLLNPHLIAVHMTQLEEDEITHLAEAGAHVVHCPQSNLKLASGLCPVQRLIDAGVNVALGTDGAASNNDLDMMAEMQSAALLAKVTAGHAAAAPATRVLRMATLDGARALGLEGELGSIEPGKSADLAAVRLDGIETQPLYNPVSQIVYAAGREQISDVWVAGQHVLKGRVLTHLDEHELLERAREWRGKIGRADEARGG